jgi:salicylate biosynthesis isochorismate synthase
VGGLPRAAALDFIRATEGFGRGWYAGPVGWLDADGGGDFAVAIRSALLRGRVARLYAGCGIVAASDPLRELEESNLKLQAMLCALS